MAYKKNSIEQYRERREKRLTKHGTVSVDRADSVGSYKERRNQRILEKYFRKISKGLDNHPELWYNTIGGGTRADAADGSDKINGEDVKWITLSNGKHVALNEEGKIVAGPQEIKGKSMGEVKKTAKEKSAKKSSGGSSSGPGASGSSAPAKTPKPKKTQYKVGTPLKGSDVVNPQLDASDCKSENVPNSAKKYLDKNGNFTPERQKVHTKIIQNMLDGKIPQPDGERVVTILGGGPASGKSALRKMAEAALPENSSVGIDPDEMKAALPGYEDLATKSTKAAGIYHEESSALAKSLYSTVLDSGLNAVYDGTGDGSTKSLKKKIDQAHAAGCKAVGSYMTLDIDEAIKRNQARYEHAKAEYDAGKSKIPPRLVAEDVVRAIHGAVTDTSIACAKYFDEFKLYDNSGPKGSKPVLIATGGNGKPITAIDRDKLQAYLDKSKNRDKYFINEKGEVEVKE